jgi:TMEM175 potassium channel family protein
VSAAHDEEVSTRGRDDQAYGLGRILAISDGVFAFALTLLVVQLVVPKAAEGSPLSTQLLDQIPAFFSYVISFAAVASTWYGHHENFRYIHRYDGKLIALNFASLMLIAFLPFPTAVLGRNQDQPLAAVIYALTLVLNNLFATAMWWYASRRGRLIDPYLDARVVQIRLYRTLAGAVVFLLSIPVALWQPIAAEIVWSAFLIVLFLFVRRR